MTTRGPSHLQTEATFDGPADRDRVGQTSFAWRTGFVARHRRGRLVWRGTTIFLPIVPTTVRIVRTAIRAIAAIATLHAGSERPAMRFGNAVLIGGAIRIRARINRQYAFIALPHIILRTRTSRNALDDLARPTRSAIFARARLVHDAIEPHGVIPGHARTRRHASGHRARSATAARYAGAWFHHCSRA